MNLWEQILQRIENKVNRHSFNTWFRPTRLLFHAGNTLAIEVPNSHFRDWLTKHYSGVIQESLGELHQAVDIVFESSSSPSPEGLPSQERVETILQPDPAPATTLTPKYTFDTFVVGASNQFAHAAARAVAEAPSRAYNPLFIYGGVGLGKTHLLHAIGHQIQQHTALSKLLYISAERFMNDLINAIRYDRIMEFRSRYRSMDVLLIDDIQFIAGKERTQEEFFHTFNALYDAQKQIVISSDAPPREIPTLEERLHSRFEWGLTADIQTPDLETKVAILRKKAEAERVVIPDNVALFIASKIKSNVRELEGSLIRLIAYSSLTGRAIDLDLVQDVLRDLLTRDERTVTLEMIQKFVADRFNLKIQELKSRNNSKSIALPRQIAMYLAKTLTQSSLPDIGKAFGGKHHSTVIHSIRKIESLRRSDADFDNTIQGLLDAFS